MIITCPSCKAQAQLPDSKEGAKVKCGECGRIYKALGGGRKARTSNSTDMTRYFIIGGAVVALFIIFMLTRGAGNENTAPAVEEEVAAKEKEAEPTDWTAPAVQAAVKLHTLATDKNNALLRGLIDGPRIQARLPLPDGSDGSTARTDFKLLSATDQMALLNTAVDELVEGELVGGWVPYDGWVVPPEQWTNTLEDSTYVVRLQVSPPAGKEELGNRHVEWHMHKVVGYKAFNWMRWISPDEIEAAKKKKVRAFTETTLSDGSQVVEGKIRAIEYMEETPKETRDQIEALIDQLVDPDSKPFKIRKELATFGKAAIPGLLTRMTEIPLEAGSNAEALNLINLTLKDITGHRTTFTVDDIIGGNAERRESGLKQWFGWYDRRFRKFTERPEDPE